VASADSLDGIAGASVDVVTAHVKPLVESGTGRERQAMAYLAVTRD
jgi:hypothetical protein